MFLAFQGDGSPFEIGQRIGAFVGILIPISFFIKAVRNFSEPDINRKCVLALTLVMGGWALSSITYALSLLSAGLAWILVVAVVPSGLSILTGIVLAIL